jgi:hypothetical protein
VGRRYSIRWRSEPMDLIYVALGVGFFAVTWLFVKLCERV